MDVFEVNFVFFVLVGLVSLYIGLFGMVWGIMNLFCGFVNV